MKKGRIKLPSVLLFARERFSVKLREDAPINLNISKPRHQSSRTSIASERVFSGRTRETESKLIGRQKQNKPSSVFISCMKSEKVYRICLELRKTPLTDKLVPLVLDLNVTVEADVHHVQAEVFARTQLRAAEAAGGARVHPLQGRAALRRGGRLKDGDGGMHITYICERCPLVSRLTNGDKGIKVLCCMQ